MEREGSRPMEEDEGESEDSGNVSQSLSNASGLGEVIEEHPGEVRSCACTGTTEPLLEATAGELASYLLPGCGALEMPTMEKSLEDLLTRVDEFVGMLDMVRSDSSQIVNESVPQIHMKAAEMKQIYRKIDRLESFVKTLGNSVALMEEQVTKAETKLGAFANPLRTFLRTFSTPPFFSKSTTPRHQQTPYEPPAIFRTEDYFPNCSEEPHT
ncbi:biogenesis of lysosome-related organelles complex 1 subunit 4 isoform X1 [Ambystoma mexicanum]|uniref:biogenesis of lysosome-related organelles complex 1 subunit 4 isoform X1 n=1 Tax=Ambystoma mexicanum TaxID=8296 RepID=UPI0037E81786